MSNLFDRVATPSGISLVPNPKVVFSTAKNLKEVLTKQSAVDSEELQHREFMTILMIVRVELEQLQKLFSVRRELKPAFWTTRNLIRHHVMNIRIFGSMLQSRGGGNEPA